MVNLIRSVKSIGPKQTINSAREMWTRQNLMDWGRGRTKLEKNVYGRHTQTLLVLEQL